MNKRKGFINLFIAGLIFGTFGIMIRILGKHMNVFEQIVLRNVFTFIFALAPVFILKEKVPKNTKPRYCY